MATQQKKIYVDNLYLIKQFDQDYQHAFQRVYEYITNRKMSEVDANVVANIAIQQCLDGMKANKKATMIISKDIKEYVSKYSKGPIYKEMKKKLCNQDYEKFNIASIWVVFMTCIVLFFLKNLMMQAFIIHYAIDAFITCIAGAFMVKNYMIRRRVIRRYAFGSFYASIDMATLAACVFIKFISDSNFDITYLMLVIAFFITKKRIKAQFEQLI